MYMHYICSVVLPGFLKMIIASVPQTWKSICHLGEEGDVGTLWSGNVIVLVVGADLTPINNIACFGTLQFSRLPPIYVAIPSNSGCSPCLLNRLSNVM